MFTYEIIFNSPSVFVIISTLIFIVLLFIVTLIGLLNLLVKYTLSKYFNDKTDNFEIRFSRGFYIIFLAGVITMVMNIIKNLINYYNIYFARKMGPEKYHDYIIKYSKVSSYIWLFNSLIIGLFILYGSLLLISSLKYYKK